MATTPSFFWGRSRAETRGGWSLSHGLDKGVVMGGSNHQGVRMRRRLMTQRLMSHRIGLIQHWAMLERRSSMVKPSNWGQTLEPGGGTGWKQAGLWKD